MAVIDNPKRKKTPSASKTKEVRTKKRKVTCQVRTCHTCTRMRMNMNIGAKGSRRKEGGEEEVKEAENCRGSTVVVLLYINVIRI